MIHSLSQAALEFFIIATIRFCNLISLLIIIRQSIR